MSIIPLLILAVGVIIRVCARLAHDTAIYALGSAVMVVGLVVITILAALVPDVIVVVAGLLFTVITIISTRHELKRLRAAALKANEGQE